ncbi:hypothetical protein [Rubrivirga sp.]|uniref:hypothetical protein n=1 Tax=Rubrivirga sp. TaxID=1885344 RepID=UPI003B523000
MRTLRLDTVRRLVAATLVAALGTSLVPAVGAQAGPPSLSAVLDDAQAFEAALEAAHAADDGADPLVVFAEAYAAAVGDVSAEALAHLLGQSSLSGVLPPAHDEALATSKVTTLTASAAVALDAPTSAPLAATLATGPEAEAPALRALAPSSRPRAP